MWFQTYFPEDSRTLHVHKHVSSTSQFLLLWKLLVSCWKSFDYLWLLNICRAKSAATMLPQAESKKSPKPQRLSCLNAYTTYILILFLSLPPWVLLEKTAWELILIWMKRSATRGLLSCSFSFLVLSLVNVALPSLEQVFVVLFWITFNSSHIQFLSFIFLKRSRIIY